MVDGPDAADVRRRDDRAPFRALYASNPASPPGEAEGGYALAEVPRIDFADGGEKPSAGEVPAAVRRVLGAGMACVMRNHELWPAAQRTWADRGFLERELERVNCAVLSAPSARKTFAYWLPPNRCRTLEESVSKGGDRVVADYAWDEPDVSQLNLGIRQFFDLSDGNDADGRGRCFYLQHVLLTPSEPGRETRRSGELGEMATAPRLGEQMRRDLSEGIDRGLLGALGRAAGLGPWVRTVLFVGTHAANGAVTRLHFDQVDNLFLQLSGRKTFRIFDPAQATHLDPYPLHHPLDRSARAELRAPGRSPRLSGAVGAEVTLGPGDLLYLPAYWWHEVVTCDAPAGGLTASVNFWFSVHDRLMGAPPPLPLDPLMRVELARQLEMLIADCLDDRAELVPAFLGALVAQLESCSARGALGGPRRAPTASPWAELHRGRPKGVRAEAWERLFEYAVGVLCLWMPSPRDALHFLGQYCAPTRFSGLRLHARAG